MPSGGQNKLTQEKVIEQLREVHGDDFDYSKVVYVNTHTPIEVRCKKHDFTFFPTPRNHKAGAKCKHCGRESQIEKARKDTDQFKKEVIEKHGDRYDLSLVEYVNTKTPVKVICKIYGLIEIRPDKLLTKNNHTPKGKKKTKSTDRGMFLEEVYKIYGDKNDYSNTVIGDSRGKIDVDCKEHGHFSVYMTNHFQGQGCPKCSAINYSLIRTKPTEDFIKEAKKIHGDSCDYTDTVYKGCREKVTIKCNVHNEIFKTLPSNHLRGSSCRKCLSDRIRKALTGKEGTGGYTKSGYVKQANGREASVYLIRCWNENEEFYKIGKTFLNIDKRFTKGNLCYNYEEVHFIYGEAGYVYDLENELHRQYKSYKYRPNNWFAGHTECYVLDLPIKEIIEL